MQTEVRVYGPLGDLRAALSDFVSLECRLDSAGVGELRAELGGRHAAIGALEPGGLVEVWRGERRPLSLFFGGFWMGRAWRAAEAERFELWAESWIGRLAKRIVAWPGGVENRSRYRNKPAETILKSLVEWNAGPSALNVNGRLRDGAIPGLRVETDGGRGPRLDWYPGLENLLGSILRLMPLSGGAVDLVRIGQQPAAWEFRYLPLRLGADRRAEVLFSLGRGNMAQPEWREDHRRAAGAAVIGGRDWDGNRAFVVRLGSEFSAVEDGEVFVNAASVGETAGLYAAGDRALAERRPERRFRFAPLQTGHCRFGRDYGLGDWVSAVNPFSGEKLGLEVARAVLTLAPDGREQIEIGLKEVA